MNIDDFEGRWAEPEGLPSAQLIWQEPGRMGLQVHVGSIEGREVAHIKHGPAGSGKPGGYIANVPGWVWAGHAPGSVGAKLGVEETPVKAFPRLDKAKAAVEYAISRLPSKL